ncbi:MAG: RCK C-terminal domain-containing protein [Nitrospira sp.]|nr:MAG: RCK C-terminal domain-containing protein [Nitrospira sp.]
MRLDFLSRLQKELSVTSTALHEAVVSIAERVNRKVQILRLHWQASSVLERIDAVSQDLGHQIVNQIARRPAERRALDPDLSEVDRVVTGATARIQALKQSLAALDVQIRQLKLETIHDDLLRLQQDLSHRASGIDRVAIPHGSAAVGQRIGDVPRSSSIHIATVMRGPFLLEPAETLTFHAGDIVVLIGGQTELDRLSVWLTRRRHSVPSATQSA